METFPEFASYLEATLNHGKSYYLQTTVCLQSSLLIYHSFNFRWRYSQAIWE